MCTCIRAYADSEGPDQTVHLRSLIWAFVVRKQNPILKNVSVKSKYPDETKNAHVQDDENPLNLRMFEGIFSLDAVQLFYSHSPYQSSLPS